MYFYAFIYYNSHVIRVRKSGFNIVKLHALVTHSFQHLLVTFNASQTTLNFAVKFHLDSNITKSNITTCCICLYLYVRV